MKQEKDYGDIINCDWNATSLPNRMPLSQRAKIFLPFSALTGYEEALAETLRKEVEGFERPTPSETFPPEIPQIQ
ncbi:MAG: hypothetical protein II367_05140 [Treponema sp.]|nr:hypothetical protein [Treponema sp.]